MINSNTSDVSENPPASIKQELINLCDSYTEFNHYCTFYCKSTSALIQRSAVELDTNCAEGMARFAQMVIEKSRVIDAQLQRLARKA